VYDNGGRTVAVQPLTQIVEWIVACVTAGFSRPINGAWDVTDVGAAVLEQPAGRAMASAAIMTIAFNGSPWRGNGSLVYSE
jgi:hypothetical protein